MDLDENVEKDDPSASRTYDETRRYDPSLFSSIAARVEIDMLDPNSAAGDDAEDGDAGDAGHLDGDRFHDEHSLDPLGGSGGGNKRGRLMHRVFGTAEHKTYLEEGTRIRGQRAMIAIPAVLAVTLLIGSIVYLGINDGDIPDAAPRGVDVIVQGGVQTPPATGGNVVLSAPPSDLAELCSEESIEFLANYERCKDECEPAACCHLPPADVLSCLVNNVESCAEYEEACRYLAHHDAQTADNAGAQVTTTVEIPTPPGDMSEICESTSLETADGYNDCEEACSAAECCTSKDCEPSNPELCGAYDPCSILTGTVSSHPDSIKSTIAKACSTSALFDGEGVEECRDACDPAVCCFADASDPESPIPSCLTDETEGWCSQYAPCHILPSLPDDDGFDSHEEATNAIDDACKGDEKDMAQCVNLCSASVCCFEETQECWESEGKVDFRCDHYAACAVVFNPFVDDNVEDDSSKTAKTQETIPEVVTLDKSNTDGGKAADEDALAYDEAAIAAAVKIEAACLPDSSSGEQPAFPDVCVDLCEERSCCFHVTEECDAKMLLIDFHCELFAPCQAVMSQILDEFSPPVVLDRNDDGMDRTSTGGGGSVQVPKPIVHDYQDDDVAAAIAVEVACPDRSDGNSGANMEECVSLCEEKICCFELTPECDKLAEDEDVDLHCELFEPCASVLGGPWDLYDDKSDGTTSKTALEGHDPPEEEIAAACKAVVMARQGDPSEVGPCVETCKNKACCFPDEMMSTYDCRTDPERGCPDVVESCGEAFVALASMELRVGNDQAVAAVAQQQAASSTMEEDQPTSSERDAVLRKIEEKCASDSIATTDGWEGCYDSCLFKRCCFAEDPDENCAMDGTEECSLYELCGAVFAYAP